MKTIARVAAAGVIAAGGMAASVAPASAQPLVTGGLVNVTVTNVANNNEIVKDVDVSLGAALGIAANICDVNVNVLATQLRDGQTTCESATGDQRVDITQA